jgi:Mechanosensitive ion channel, conserved TM helix
MGDYLVHSLQHTLGNFIDMTTEFLPRLMAMLIIMAVGWLIALALKLIVKYALSWLKFSRVSDTAGITQLLSKAALPPPQDLLSRLVFWVVGIAFMFLGFSALGIFALQQQISEFFLLLPQIFVALLVLFVGLLAADFFSRAALLAAVNANVPSPRLFSAPVRFLITIVAVSMALDQVGLGRHVVLIAFSMAFGAVMLAMAIAFGLGGRDAAKHLIEKRLSKEPENEDQEEISHL